MAIGDKYVMNGVWLTCDKGVAPSRFNVTPKPVQLYDEHFANELDKIPLVNIMPFGVCSVTRTPCMPAPVLWERVMEDGLTVLGARPLVDTSKCVCGVGGQIAIHFTKADASAAVDLDQKLDKVDEVADAAESASTWAFWGGIGLAVGGAILCATGVGAPLGAAMIAGGEVLVDASMVLAVGATVAKGATKFARDPSLQNGLSIVGEVLVNVAIDLIINKVGGKVVKVLGEWGQKAMNKLGLSKKACELANHILCTVTGHPVDVINGYLYTEAVDFEFPGPVPLRWNRLWNSTSIHEGPLGHGWHHSYDLALVIEAGAGLAALRAADGRGIAFELPTPGERSYNRLEKMSLLHDERGYAVLDHGQGLGYRFGPARPDGVQLLAAVENANGFAITFTYDERGYLAGIVDSARRQFQVQCDEQGRILAIVTAHPTEPRQTVALVTYDYNNYGELIRATDALGQTAIYQYQDRLLVQETLKNGLNFYFEYVGTGPEARCVHTWGDEGIYDHKLVYDLEARRTVVTNSLGYATTYFGNENGLVVEKHDARGGVTLTEYNEYNEVTSETNQLGHSTAYTYDERGNCLQTLLPDGATFRRTFNSQDALIQIINPIGAQWQWKYDAAGNLLAETNALGNTNHYAYAHGRLQRAMNATKQLMEYVYDAGGNRVELRSEDGQPQRWLYDKWGRARKLIDTRGNVQWREHDLLGRVVTLHEPDGNVRQFTYDGLDNVVRMQDRHYDVRYYYQGLGRLVRRVEAGTVVEFWHDTEEQLRAVVNEHGLAYRFERDREGDIAVETGFDGLTRRYQRDQAGQVIELELPTGQGTRYSYDPIGRITAIDYADGSSQTYQYRADGALLAADLNDKTIRLAYDIAGNLKKECQGIHELTNDYDALGRRVAVRSSLGADVHYTRNESGDAERIKTDDWQALLEYDAHGLEMQRTLSSGVRTRWQRDQVGRPLTQRIRTGAGHTERLRNYGWQENNKLVQLEDSLRGTTHFEYDVVGNLAAATFGDGAAEKRWPDSVGNLFRTEQRSDRKYGPAGQLLVNQGTRYTYDQTGNLSTKLTADQQEWGYRWNAQGHLAEVVCPDGKVVYFQYDALGRRVSKSYQGRVTHWFWDGNAPLHEWTTDESDSASRPAVVTWLFQDQSFVPMARLEGKDSCDILTDHLGTPFAVHDSQGQVVWDAEFTTYGQLRHSKGDSTVCPFRYQGQYEDVETGLYYNGLRYYDPADGVYISQDPIRLKGGMMVYGYVRDTNNWIDPLGLANFPTNVDFTGHPDLFPATGNQSSIVTIKMQGARDADFTEAFKLSKIPKSSASDYTWHHMHDFNPATGETTMQLINTDAHKATLPHKGSVAQYEQHFGMPSKSYGTYDAKMKAYNEGWRTKKPKLKCPVT